MLLNIKDFTSILNTNLYIYISKLNDAIIIDIYV